MGFVRFGNLGPKWGISIENGASIVIFLTTTSLTLRAHSKTLKKNAILHIICAARWCYATMAACRDSAQLKMSLTTFASSPPPLTPRGASVCIRPWASHWRYARETYRGSVFVTLAVCEVKRHIWRGFWRASCKFSCFLFQYHKM